MLVKEYSNGVEVLSLNINKLKDSLRVIAKKIKEEHPQVERVILFGSMVKNCFTPLSDIDIAIITTKSVKEFIMRQDEFIDYFLLILLDVNIVVYTEKEMKHSCLKDTKGNENYHPPLKSPLTAQRH